MGELVWDERLISRDEFWDLACAQPVRPGIRRGLLFADCGQCGQAVLPLGTVRAPFTISCAQLAGAVLRHRVSAHGMPLDHRRRKREGTGRPDAGAAGGGDSEHAPADRRGGVPGRRGDRAAADRPAPETAGGGGEPGTAGGDRG